MSILMPDPPKKRIFYKEPDCLQYPESLKYYTNYVYRPPVTKETETKIETVTIVDVYYKKVSEPDKEYVYGYSRKEVDSHRKFLAIGGPLDGQLIPANYYDGEYIPYNIATRNRSEHKLVNIHMSLLKTK